MKHKYVRHSTLGVALFPAFTELAHADIAYMMRRKAETGQIVSAAFAWIESDKVIIEGRSESLNMGPAIDDGAFIAAQIGIKRAKS